MQRIAEQRLRLVNDHIDREHRRAAAERLADEARHRYRRPLRLRAAHQLIRLGERLATERPLTPVRPR